MWYDEPRKLVDFAKALEAAGYVEDMKQVVDVPYKYSTVYELWEQLDFPTEEDSEWDQFVEQISSDEE